MLLLFSVTFHFTTGLGSVHGRFWMDWNDSAGCSSVNNQGNSWNLWEF